MSPVDRVGPFTETNFVSSWVHMRNFSPLTDTRKGTRILELVLGAKFEKQNKCGGETC